MYRCFAEAPSVHWLFDRWIVSLVTLVATVLACTTVLKASDMVYSLQRITPGEINGPLGENN